MGFNYPLPEQVRETAVLNCDGVSTTYGPFDFKIFDEADITVYRKRTGEALYSILTTVTVTKQAALPFDYFTITFPSVEPATTKFKVSSERVHSRSIGVDRGTGLNVDALDKELSKQATILQELVRNFSTRTVQVDVGQVALLIDPGIVDGDTLMKSGNRLVKGASASEITNAQSYASQALTYKNDAAASAAAAQTWNPTNYYTKTQSDTNYYTKTQSDTNYYTKAQVDPKQVFATKAANYTAVVADNNAYHTFSAASLTLSLTAPGTLGASWHYDGYAAGGALTVTPASGLINGLASIAVPQFCNFSIKCDGTNFTCVIDPAKQYVDNTVQGINLVLNGDMRIAIAGTNFTSPASGSYTLDGWIIAWSGAAPASVAQVSGPSGFRNAQRVTGAAGNTLTALITRFESIDVAHLVGGPVAVQVNLAASTPQTFRWELYYAGSLDIFSAPVLIASGTWSVTATAQTFTAVSGNLPAGAANGLQLSIYPNNAGAFASGTFDLTGVQLEKGSVITAFQTIWYPLQLKRAQRYRRAVAVGLGGYASGAGLTIYGEYTLGDPMRIAPTATILVAGTAVNASASALTIKGPDSYRWEVTAAGAGGFYSLDRTYLFSATL